MAALTVPAENSVAGDLALLDGIKTALAGAKLMLYKSSLVPTRDTLIADFTAAKCDFTGYADETLTWSAIGVAGDGRVVFVSSRAFFQGDDPLTVPDSVGGAYLTLAAGGLVKYYPFTGPIGIDQALKFIAAELQVSLEGGELEVEY